MELKDIISEGKIDREGMIELEKVFEENKHLKEAFAYQHKEYYDRDGYTSEMRYYTKENMSENLLNKNKQLGILSEESSKALTELKIDYYHLQKLIKKIKIKLENNYFVRSSKIIKILDNE